jgi:hypothetical protein
VSRFPHFPRPKIIIPRSSAAATIFGLGSVAPPALEDEMISMGKSPFSMGKSPFFHGKITIFHGKITING